MKDISLNFNIIVPSLEKQRKIIEKIGLFRFSGQG